MLTQLFERQFLFSTYIFVTNSHLLLIFLRFCSYYPAIYRFVESNELSYFPDHVVLRLIFLHDLNNLIDSSVLFSNKKLEHTAFVFAYLTLGSFYMYVKIPYPIAWGFPSLYSFFYFHLPQLIGKSWHFF